VLTALWARTPEQAPEIEVSLAHVDREDVGTLDTKHFYFTDLGQNAGGWPPGSIDDRD
jgi:hypothetical protein